MRIKSTRLHRCKFWRWN